MNYFVNSPEYFQKALANNVFYNCIFKDGYRSGEQLILYMDKDKKYEELSEKLRSVTERHSLFTREIHAIKMELEELRGESSDEKYEVNEELGEDVWPESVDLEPIKKQFASFNEERTKAGTYFIQVKFEDKGAQYLLKIADSGKWLVNTAVGELIAHGRHRNQGSELRVDKGANEGRKYKSDTSSFLNLVTEAITNEKASTVEISVEESNIREVVAVKEKKSSNLGIEKFIGENLITIIGVVIVLIGVIFGVKYSIDHNLINPLTRIVLGYLLGIGILAVGMKLKKKYETFSAVLVSGSMAIMYFVTFTAYSLYHLIPQIGAFGIMALFTVFTVYSAIHYSKQVIAHIGLVGAYAVPFLLSNNSGNIFALFSYMTLINVGILVIAFKKKWKPLYYAAFAVSWLIFLGWFLTTGEKDVDEHFGTAFTFASIFFLKFYVMFLSYKLIAREKFDEQDVVMVVLNSFTFYGIGCGLLDNVTGGDDFLGLFTLGTGAIHFVSSVLLFRSEHGDKRLFHLTSGLVLVFLTIAIPVQLDGHWVTLIWAAEAALMFWLGRTREVRFNEILSYCLMGLTLLSLVEDYFSAYDVMTIIEFKPNNEFSGVTFFTALFVIATFGFIYYVSRIKIYRDKLIESHQKLAAALSVVLPSIVILLVFIVFFVEINMLFTRAYVSSIVQVGDNRYVTIGNKDYNYYGNLAKLAYVLCFTIGLSVLNKWKFKSYLLAKINSGAQAASIFLFLAIGLLTLSELRESFLSPKFPNYFEHQSINVWVRYVMYIPVTIAALTLRNSVLTFLNEKKESKLKMLVNLYMHVIILWILCAELINILDLSNVDNQYLLGVSILCGIYAFVMVGIGIMRKKQYLRIAAISLFGAVLIKLFFMDLAELSTIGKTVVFIVLGIILLVISFMYNKYKNLITDEN